MKAVITDGDKLSQAQSKVDAVSAQMQQNLSKIIENQAEVNVSKLVKPNFLSEWSKVLWTL